MRALALDKEQLGWKAGRLAKMWGDKLVLNQCLCHLHTLISLLLSLK